MTNYFEQLWLDTLKFLISTISVRSSQLSRDELKSALANAIGYSLLKSVDKKLTLHIIQKVDEFQDLLTIEFYQLLQTFLHLPEVIS